METRPYIFYTPTYTIYQDLRIARALLHTTYFYYPLYQLQIEGVTQECDSELSSKVDCDYAANATYAQEVAVHRRGSVISDLSIGVFKSRSSKPCVLLAKLCSELVGQPCQTCPEVVKSLNSFHLHLRHIHASAFEDHNS